MTSVNIDKLSKQYRDMLNDAFESHIIKHGEQYDIVKEAMLYSLESGGKRVRPILVLEFCRLNGGSINAALPLACAVEMVHCYSLIHDDLPCMDDDDMRRGMPSCHKKYGEAVALLAGDALLTLAFEIIAEGAINGMISYEKCVEAISILAMYVGADGMIAGQTLDLINEGKEIDEQTLNTTHMKKTGSLIRAACRLGAIAAGAKKEVITKCEQFGQRFGLAFQIIDDVMDVTADEKALGKPNGSDKDNCKTTFVTLYGVENAKRIAKENAARANSVLLEFDGSEYLQSVVQDVLKRA